MQNRHLIQQADPFSSGENFDKNDTCNKEPQLLLITDSNPIGLNKETSGMNKISSAVMKSQQIFTSECSF